MGWFIYQDNLNLSEPTYGQIFLASCNDVTIANQILFHTSIGIMAIDCFRMEVKNNTCCCNGRFGIFLSSCSYSIVEENICNDNEERGIVIGRSTDLSLSRNKCYYNYYSGVTLGECSYSDIFHNICYKNNNEGLDISSECTDLNFVNNTCYKNNGVGFVLGNLDNILIESNFIGENKYYGISLRDTSNCFFQNNIIIDNTNYGICVFSLSNNNEIHHNNIINTITENYLAYDEGENNLWHSEISLKGNYWSSWLGIGTYLIDGPAEAEDLYPLSEAINYLIPIIEEIACPPIPSPPPYPPPDSTNSDGTSKTKTVSLNSFIIISLVVLSQIRKKNRDLFSISLPKRRKEA